MLVVLLMVCVCVCVLLYCVWMIGLYWCIGVLACIFWLDVGVSHSHDHI